MFSFLAEIFKQLVYRPLLNLLVFLYNLPLVDFGVAIILLTILTKIITWRLDVHAIIKQREAQIKSTEIQEEMDEIKKKYKDDPKKQNEETIKLWREKKFNPFSSFGPLLVQMIILLALFQLFRVGIGAEQLKMLYHFVENPGAIEPSFLKIPLDIFNLAKPNYILAIITGIVFFVHSKMTLVLQEKYFLKKKKKRKSGQKKNQGGMQKIMQNQLTYFMPLFIGFICLRVPAALPLYWSLSTAINILQVRLTYKKAVEKDGQKV